jgi:release factor glutamine methyltransferase
MKIASNKIKDVVKFFEQELSNSYERDELQTIMQYCFEAYLNLKRPNLFLLKEQTMSESVLLKFNFAIKELKNHRPIQYILGEADFYRMKLKVNEHVLIPRPETEELVQLIIAENKNTTPVILDIGTGSGCIAIALKKNSSAAKVIAMDVSEGALNVAKQNALLNNTDVEFIHDSILNPISNLKEETFLVDIIVSNPPYICFSEKENMQKNVVEYEPHLALFVADNDPLLFYKSIANFAIKHLRPNGILYLEINQAFGAESKLLLEEKGFKNVKLIQDLNNNYRILRGHI